MYQLPNGRCSSIRNLKTSHLTTVPSFPIPHPNSGAYFHYGSKDFEAPKCVDISPNPGRSDPMFIVQAAKKMEKAAA